MQIATLKSGDNEIGVLVINQGFISIKELKIHFSPEIDDMPENLWELLQTGDFYGLWRWYNRRKSKIIEFLDHKPDKILLKNANLGPLYRMPSKIWGIGLNYVDHAADLAEKAPNTEPASFMKPYTTIIGHQDTILIPQQSNKTTGEAELGIIIGKKCKGVSQENWLDVVAGFTTIIDMTAEDILRKNPRYLTLSKSFDTFFSFGPLLITPDEFKNVMDLKIATVINGKIHAENIVSNMMFPPDFLVSFHSHVMTFMPGDIISTGTPRAVSLADGDNIECKITGFYPLKNDVHDLKLSLTP